VSFLNRIETAAVTADNVRDAVAVAGVVITGAAVGAALATERKWLGAAIGAAAGLLLPGVFVLFTRKATP
jgi:ABC-type uncharacterized transport system permease subunit